MSSPWHGTHDFVAPPPHKNTIRVIRHNHIVYHVMTASRHADLVLLN